MMDDGDRFTSEGDGTVRDRLKSPSINFPRSEEEAFQALLHSVKRALVEEDIMRAGPLGRTYTTDAGLGTVRTQQQADWLNQQAQLIKARVEDLLDSLDLECRLGDESTS